MKYIISRFLFYIYKLKKYESTLAYVHPGAKIAKNVVIEPLRQSNNVVIGDGTWIGSNVTIMEGARIGKNCIFSWCLSRCSSGFKIWWRRVFSNNW
jgi:acetyltransferase-like isoleucine patch superfamily enzyme